MDFGLCNSKTLFLDHINIQQQQQLQQQHQTEQQQEQEQIKQYIYVAEGVRPVGIVASIVSRCPLT